jgi:superfamily II DNA or RNA helicase
MLVTIDNRIRIAVDLLAPEELLALQKAFTYANPEYAKLKGMGRKFVPKRVPKVLTTWELGGGCLSLPRGGIDKVRAVLAQSLRVKRRMSFGDPELAGKIPDHRLQPRPYQSQILQACIDTGTALVRSPPGSGKTFVGYSIAAKLKLATLVVVPTERILQQWIRGVDKNFGMRPEDVGIIQGSTRVIKPLTIGMQQTLKNCSRDYLNVFGVVIGDESQRFAADTFFDVIDLFPAAYRIGMSADERRADKKEFLVYDVFGQVAVEIPRQTLIDQGAIIDAEVRVVPTSFEAPWYTGLKPQKRADAEVQSRLAVELSEDVERNRLVMHVLEWCARENEPTITLTWRREHCTTLNSMALARGFGSGVLMGGKDSQAEFDRTERELTDGELKQAVGTYQAVGVGFDLPLVSRGIFAGPCAGNNGKQQFAQFCGRYERPEPATGKVNPYDSAIYYLWDHRVYGLNPLRNIVKWKPKVTVLDGDAWVPAKEYLKAHDRRDEHDDDVLDVVSTP